jgi:hypothetical protein
MKLFNLGYLIMACTQPASWGLYSSGGTVGDYMVDSFGVNDPVQSTQLKNCSLIAAFASLAWKSQLIDQPGPKYTFKFYRKDSNNNTVMDSVTTDGILPLDSTGKLKYARSETLTEIWPAVYEKAYYIWLDKPADGKPNYCNHIEFQNPATVLFQLTGKTVSPIPPTPLVDETAFDKIDAFCVNYISITNRAIKSPAVAWTYDYGDQYSDTKIIAQHTYSLLGVAGEKVNKKWTEKKYVVLRNPHGTVKGDPKGLPDGSLYTSALWSEKINLGNEDGLFALHYKRFPEYFAGYAWIL